MRITRSAAAIGVTLLALGALGGAAVSSRPVAAVTPVPKPPPAEVRTVVVTQTIHRVRRERMHRKTRPAASPPAAAGGAPPAATAAPAPVQVAAVQAPAAQAPLRSRTSGAKRVAVAAQPAKPLRARTSGSRSSGAAPKASKPLRARTSGSGGGHGEHEHEGGHDD